MRRGGASRRRAADPGLPVPADRPAAGCGRNRQGGQRQEGPVPGALRRAQHGAAARVRRSDPHPDGVRRAREEPALMQPGEARPHDHGLPTALYVISGASFAAALSARALDPVLPHVAEDFGVSIATAAGFAAVFAFTFSIIQPIVGAAADLFGKTRLMIGCLALLGLANILGALSSSFSVLFATRILAGIGSGGVFPVALSLTSDLVGPEKRQIAIGRTLMGSMTGNLLGASVSGLIGDFLGWRGVLAVLGLLVIVASVAVTMGFRGAALTQAPKTNFAALKQGYRTIFSNPNAFCYVAVFVEGCCVLGLFPYIAAFLFELGETSLSVAGLVIAGFAVGGLFYTLSVSRFLPLLGVKGMMISGATLVGLALAVVAF